MAGEGIIQIGATVDKTGVEAGLQSIREGVQSTVQTVAVQVEETTARTRAAWNKLSADVKEAASSVSAEAIRVAEATKAQTAAMGDLRRASVLARDANLEEAETTPILAAAQVKAAAAAAEVAAAKRAEADAVAAAAEEEALSENVVIAAFQRAALAVRESCTLIEEKLVQTAEAGNLSAEGIAGGFSGLGALLGAGLAVGFAGHYLDELAKVNVELEHLSTKTEISVTALAGLQQIMKEAGGDFETAATGLVRMESNTEKLSQGDKILGEAFTNLGLRLEDVRAAKPEELLQMIATGMANTADANVRANSAIQIFGRGGQQLIPVLREQGALLTANMQATGRLTGITDESALAARRWTQDMAKLSAELRSATIPLLELAAGALGVVQRAMVFVGAGAAEMTEVISLSARQVENSLATVGQVAKDLANPLDWGSVASDAKKGLAQESENYADFTQRILAMGRATANELANISFVPEAAPGSQDEQTLTPKKAPARGANRAEAALRADEEALNELKLDHELTLEEEIAFWQKRLETVKKGSEEYRAIVAKLAPLEQRELKQPAAAQGAQAGALEIEIAEGERALAAPAATPAAVAARTPASAPEAALAAAPALKPASAPAVAPPPSPASAAPVSALAPVAAAASSGESAQSAPAVAAIQAAPAPAAAPAVASGDAALDALKRSHQLTLDEEISFWQKRLAAAKKGSADYRAIEATLVPLEQRKLEQIAPAKPETQSLDLAAAPQQQAPAQLAPASPEGELVAGLQAQEKAAEAATAQGVESARAGAEEQMLIGKENLADFEHDEEFKVRTGQISEQQRIIAVRQAIVQENQARQQQAAFVEALDMGDSRKYREDLKQEQQATRQATRAIVQLNQQAALEVQQQWKQAFDKMTNEFNADVAKWVVSGKGFQESMQKFADGIAENFVKNLLKMTEQEILAALQHKALMSQTIIADAKTAAANAFSWASGWGGPIAGAVAAAAAFAGVMAFDTFEAGGVVRGGGQMAVPILAHAGERVLSTSQTSNFEKLVNQSSSSATSVTNHLHYEPKVDGNAPGMKRQLRQHADEILAIVREGYRSGNLTA